MASIDQNTAQDGRERFSAAFPIIQRELLNYLVQNGMPDDAIEWYCKALEWNVPGGKLNRGLSVVDTVQILRGGTLADDQEYFRAAVLGWCVELLQAFFLVSDDIMDSSVTRRGQPCWYRVEGVGMTAFNDALLIESAIYYLLKKYFRTESYYIDLLEQFHETTFQTEMGQLIDLITASEDVVDLSKFSLTKHRLIVIYKTAFYSFYLPVALAMHLVGITSPTLYSQAQSILIPLGEYFQVQDDYLDCYGPPAITGKVGTDILDNKCAWPINVALDSCTPEQRRVLEENYGRKSVEGEARVKTVYGDLGIPAKYAEYEQVTYEKIKGLINDIPEDVSGIGLKREVFSAFLDKIYRRTK